MEGPNYTTRNISYLRARDPSIISYSRPQLAQIRTNLIPQLEDIESVVENQSQDNNIRVYLRVKKIRNATEELYMIKGNTLVAKVPENSNSARNLKPGETICREYTFSEIFDPSTTQTELFNHAVKPKILEFINGTNSTLLTYGASGSGKTFTVIGTDEYPGLVPRSLEYLFKTLPALPNHPKYKPCPTGDVQLLSGADIRREYGINKSLLNTSVLLDKSHHVKIYRSMQDRLSSEPVAQLDSTSGLSLSVWISFAEIYNENIYDLLQTAPLRNQQKVRLRLGSANAGTYVKNLTYVNVSSGLEAYLILQYGLQYLNYAATNVNSHSSRSHSIFTVKLVQVSEVDGGRYVNNFNFCDLAGCERTKKTLNIGDRLKESNNINNSLLVLGRCISAIRDSQKQHDQRLIPFRESKLTQLFQKALAGFEDIAMIVTISPTLEMFDETTHVLNFSAVAKQISVDKKEQMPPKAKKKNRFTQLLEAEGINYLEFENEVETLKHTIIMLQEQLEEQRIEHETNEKINREYVIEGYKKLLQEIIQDHERQIEEVKKSTKAQCESKIQALKSEVYQLKEKNEVISLDSDEEESDEMQPLMENLKEEVNRLNEQLVDHTCVKHELENLKREHSEKLAALNDAVAAYSQLQIVCKELSERCDSQRNEILLLEEKCQELEMRESAYAHELSKCNDDSEEEELTTEAPNYA